MSSLRSSRAVSNLQVETIRFSRTAIPEGATGSVFAIDDDGFMTLTSDVVASTLTVGGTVSIGGVLQVGSLAVQQLLDVSSAVIANLRVTNSITLPPSVVIPTGSTSVEALYIFAGVTNVPIDGDYLQYALDVSGASIMRGKMTTLGPISARSIFVEGATADVVFRSGSTAAADGRIQGTGSQLLIGSDSTIALGSLSGATIAMTVQPRLVSITAGTTLNVQAIGGVGLAMAAPTTFTGVATFAATPIFTATSTFNGTPTFNAPSTFNGPATFSGTTLTILPNAFLDVQSGIKNSVSGQSVLINDSLAVNSTLKMLGGPIEAQSQPLVLQATGGFGVSVVGDLQVSGGVQAAGISVGGLTVAGNLGAGTITATGISVAGLTAGTITATGISVAGLTAGTITAAGISVGGLTVAGNLAVGGNVGVGTAPSLYTLDVSGTLRVLGTVGEPVPTISTNGYIQTAGDNNLVSINPFGGINMTGDLAVRQAGGGITGQMLSLLSPNLGGISYINARGGSVGVGTTTPAYTLDVSGTLRVLGTVGEPVPTISTNGYIQTAGDNNNNLVSINPFGGINMTGDLAVRQAGGGITGQTLSLISPNPGGISYINARGGSVGVGTTTPAYTLDVSGTLRVLGTVGEPVPTISTNGYIQTAGVNNNLVSINPFGGINMTGELAVKEAGAGISGPALTLISPNPGEVSYINARGGSVGVGTTTPSYTLDVSGSVRISQGLTVTGNIYAQGTMTARGLSIPFPGTANISSLTISNYFNIPGLVYTTGFNWTSGTVSASGEGNYFQIGNLLVRWIDTSTVPGFTIVDGGAAITWDNPQFVDNTWALSVSQYNGSPSIQEKTTTSLKLFTSGAAVTLIMIGTVLPPSPP
jgi:hypothetical protein